MKKIRHIVYLLATLAVLGTGSPVAAQCSMCTLNAENSTQNGQTQGRGLNNGILFLLAMPYLAVAGIGILWYTKYRKKNTAV